MRVLQSVAVCCRVLQCVAVCYSASRCVSEEPCSQSFAVRFRRTLQSEFCSAFQFDAARCNVLRSVVVHCREPYYKRTPLPKKKLIMGDTNHKFR